MPSGTWITHDGRLAIATQTGTQLFPTASDVYEVAFRGRRTISGFDVPNPIEALPTIKFSRVPAESGVRLRASESGAVSIECGVIAGASFTLVPDVRDAVIAASAWYPIEHEELSAMGEWLAARSMPRQGTITVGQLIALRTATGAPFRLVDEVGQISVVDGEIPALLDGDIPGLRAELYPYQRSGVAFMRMIGEQDVGCLLADEMGLGKTLQVIALIQDGLGKRSRPSLVVAPVTLLENWRREFAQFAPGIRILVHTGSERAGVASILKAFDVVVTSYDTVIRDEPLLLQVDWDVVAVDEAQNIKNPDTQRATAVKRLKRRVSIAVTGTPVENRLTDMWSICDFCLPGLLGDVTAFRGNFADAVNDASRLSEIVSPIVIRRRIADVATDLPERIEIPTPIRMSLALAEAYEAVRLETIAGSGAGPGIVEMMRLRQMCAHPSLLMKWDRDPTVSMPKYQRLVEVLEEIFAAGQKALVFCSFHALTDLMMNDLPSRWPNGFFAHIDGRLPVNDRQPLVDSFAAFPTFGALVLNPKAAGVGLNITAANHVIHYMPEWNPAVTDQASSRSYRRKQELPVTIHHFYFVDSVEEIMVGRSHLKRQLADHAVTGHVGDADSVDVLNALQVSPLANRNELSQ